MRTLRFAAVWIAVAACAPEDLEDASGDAPCPRYYEDRDGDGHGNPAASTTTCDTQPDGYAVIDDDCHDENPFIHPEHPEVCDGLDNDCDGAFETNCPTDCTLTLDRETRRRYLACTAPRLWQAARDLCQQHGFDLAHVDDEVENEFIRNSLPLSAGGRTHLGGVRVGTDDTWEWADDHVVFWETGASTDVYAKWAWWREGGNCLALDTDQHAWIDATCDQPRMFTCERSR
jgi:hypothetical protein